MSGEVQLIPPGLLAFLGIKNLGQNPQRLGDAYAPVLDMVPWSFMARAETLQVGFAPGTVGGNLLLTTFNTDVTFTVPQQELWYVHWLSVGIAPGAAATRLTGPSVGMRLDVNGVAKIIALATQPVIYTNDGINVAARDFFAPSGAQLGWFAAIANAAATNAAGLSALITRLAL